jgi:hypothetical protein
MVACNQNESKQPIRCKLNATNARPASSVRPEEEALGVYPVISLPLELHRLEEGKMTLCSPLLAHT